MDRNQATVLVFALRYGVALRKESVDRNGNLNDGGNCGLPVALRKESVDRNIRQG